MEMFSNKTLLASTIVVAFLAISRAIVRRKEWNGDIKFFLDSILTTEIGEFRHYILTVYRYYVYYLTLWVIYLISTIL